MERPEDLEGLLEEAYQLLCQLRPEEAEERIQRVLSSEPGNPRALCYLGIVRLQQGRRGEAEQLLRHSLSLRPDQALARYYLGHLLYRRGAWEEARAHLEEALRLDPSLSQARQLLERLPRFPGPLANFWARAVSATLDGFALSILILPAFIVFALPSVLSVFRSHRPPGCGLALGFATNLAFDLAVLVISGLFYTLPWAIWGRTPGMVVIGLKLVDGRGEKPSFWRAFVRWLVYQGWSNFLTFPGFLAVVRGLFASFVSFVLSVLNVVLISATPKRQAVHDLAAGTFVVGRSLPAWVGMLILVAPSLLLIVALILALIFLAPLFPD